MLPSNTKIIEWGRFLKDMFFSMMFDGNRSESFFQNSHRYFAYRCVRCSTSALFFILPYIIISNYDFSFSSMKINPLVSINLISLVSLINLEFPVYKKVLDAYFKITLVNYLVPSLFSSPYILT